MAFNVVIQPSQTRPVYGIRSDSGYQINSDIQLSCDAIKKILGIFVENCIAQDNMIFRETRFQDYVAWKPETEWGEEAEYAHYKRAVERLNIAESNLYNLKEQYKITSITAFENP